MCLLKINVIKDQENNVPLSFEGLVRDAREDNQQQSHQEVTKEASDRNEDEICDFQRSKRNVNQTAWIKDYIISRDNENDDLLNLICSLFLR